MSTGFRTRRERAKGTSLKSKGQGLQTEGGRPARLLSLGRLSGTKIKLQKI